MILPLNILMITAADAHVADLLANVKQEGHSVVYFDGADKNLDVNEVLKAPYDIMLMDIAFVANYCDQLPDRAKVAGLIDPGSDKPLYKLSALQKYCGELIAKPLTLTHLLLLIKRMSMRMSVGAHGLLKPKVLVVEKDELARFAAITIIEDYFQVQGCASLDEAITVLNNNSIQILLVGIDQKKSQLMEEIHWVRLQQPNLLVIVMTSLSNKQLVMSAIQGGMVDIIEKPLRPDSLIRTVNRVWQLGQSLIVNQHLITSLSDSYHELQTVALELGQFVEHSPVAIAMLDCDYRYLVNSIQWTRVFKIKCPDSLSGQRLEQGITDQCLLEQWYECFNRCLQGETIREQEYQLVHQDGGVDWLSWKLAAWQQNNGGTGGVILVVRVITERKEAERERLALEQRLFKSQKLEAIGQFAGGVFHDLNKLLTPVVGNLDLLKLQLKEESGELQALLQDALNSTELIRTMAKQLLAVVRETPIQLSSVEIVSCVQQSLKIVSTIVPDSIDFRVQINLTPTIIETDEAGITRILLNLVSNAIDAFSGKPGTVSLCLSYEVIESEKSVTVTTGVLSGREYVKLVVTDNGPGIDAKALQDIFQPLVTTKSIEGGTGLGLSVVLSTVKKLNGHIHVESHVAQGCSFSVYLPLLSQES